MKSILNLFKKCKRNNVNENNNENNNVSENNNFNNIYIKKDTDKNNFQITYAKKGVIKNNNGITVLELYDGQNTNSFNDKITTFSFSKSEFNLSLFTTNTILVKKTQEHSTLDLAKCVKILTDERITDKSKIKQIVRNCEIENLDNIISELYKSLVVPLYTPDLMLTALLLIIHSKEKINYTKYRLILFLLGFFIIVVSESTLRFITHSFYNNLVIILVPFITLLTLYFYFLLKFNFKKD